MIRYRFNRKELKIIQLFTKHINDSLKIKRSENKRFECDIPKNTIYLGTKKIDLDNEDIFQEWIQKQPEYIKINRILLSLLHEIGHFQTFNQEEFDFRNQIEKNIIFMYENDIISYEDLNIAYWEMPNEKKATLWGLNYFKNNRKECEELAAALDLGRFDLD